MGSQDKTIFQKQLEKSATKNIFFLVVIGCLFFSVAIFGIKSLNIRLNAEKYLEFSSKVFENAYASAKDYLEAPSSQEAFIRCITEGTDGKAVLYSLNRHNVTSPIPMEMILSDPSQQVVYSSFGQEAMNLHRLAFNRMVDGNALKAGGGMYQTVYYFSGDTSEYVLSMPLYQGGKLVGFANAYINGRNWSRLFSDYQYDSMITTLGGDIIFCSRPGFLPERSANKYRGGKKSAVYLHNIPYLVASRELEPEGILIYSFLYNPNNAIYLLMGIVTIAVLGAIWSLMFLKLSQAMAEKNARAVGMLADEMRIIRHGDSSHQIQIGTGDEFEEIANQINRMVKSLQELNKRNMDLIQLNSMIEIRNLQAQVNPHFIYNTLDTIKYLICAEPDKAAHLIEKFTHILRYSINNTKPDVLLGEDMGYIEDYLYIQRIRFGSRLACSIDIEPECLGYYVPKLLLQPIVENSIKYGFKKKMAIAISIQGRQADGHVALVVEDNGPGVPRATLETLRAMLDSEELKTEHNGLQNLARRIVLEYGDGSGMALDSREGEFFRVTVALKYKDLAAKAGIAHLEAFNSRDGK